MTKEFSAEETDFVKPAIAIVQTGHPLFYQFEQKQKYELALWHPPMYIYSLSVIAIFSTNEILLRMPNFILSIFTAVIVFLFCIRINETNGWKIGLIASTFFLINYYVFCSSNIIDIDVFSMFFIFLFFYLIISYFKTQKTFYAAMAAITFLFALSNRYPIAIFTFLTVGICFFIKRETRKFSVKYFFIGLISGLIFLSIWTFYSTIIEPGTFFSFIKHNANLGYEQFSSLPLYLASFSLNISQFIRLFTLPAVILFVMSAVYFIKKKYDLYGCILLAYCFTILLFFIIIPRPAFGYPRYFLTVMPAFFILVAQFLYDNLSQKIGSRKIIFIAVISVISLLMLLIFNPNATIYRNDGLIRATNLPDFVFNVICICPIFFAFFFKKDKRKLFLIMALVGSLLAYSIYFDIKTATNDSKIKDVAEYLKQNTNNSSVIAPKAVGHYYGGKFYANDYYRPDLSKLNLKFFIKYILESYNNPKMDSELFWGKDIYGGIYVANYNEPDKNLYEAKYVVTNYQSSNITAEKIIGNYYIYKIKDI